jgi:hypothetical protein
MFNPFETIIQWRFKKCIAPAIFIISPSPAFECNQYIICMKLNFANGAILGFSSKVDSSFTHKFVLKKKKRILSHRTIEVIQHSFLSFRDLGMGKQILQMLETISILSTLHY